MEVPSALPHLIASIPVSWSLRKERVGADHWKRIKSSVESTFTQQLLCPRLPAHRNQ